MEIRRGFSGLLLFFLLRIVYSVQWLLSKAFWILAIAPMLWLTKVLNFQKNTTTNPTGEAGFVTLDFLKPFHEILWRYLDCTSKIFVCIAGTPSRLSYYDRLLRWNPEIPIIGFEVDKTKYSFRLLYKPSGKNQDRGVNFVWIQTSKKIGEFQIVEKHLAGRREKEVAVVCVWISGKNFGKSFEVKSNTTPDDLTNNLVPREIYCPPKLVIFLFEAIVSVSFILSLIQLSKGGFEVLNNIFNRIINFHCK